MIAETPFPSRAATRLGSSARRAVTRAASSSLTAAISSSAAPGIAILPAGHSLAVATNIPRMAKKATADDVLAARFHSAILHLLRRLAQEDRTSGITPARLSALYVLVFGGERTIGSLASAERVTPPTMTRL